ncbi:arsenic resistance protein [Halomonas sp. GXIMD04776]|uniref:arsenic resistance protein n=1 Tax=Halomonas sp. GXIMD04776 TaxID=3415605 RepID=UPI003C8F5F46
MRATLEQHQVWIYLTAILVGLAIGWGSPDTTQRWEIWLWPLLGVLLYTTFTQVPLLHLTRAFRDRRFMMALMVGNFLLVPLAVAALSLLLPEQPAIRLGVLLVLLVPCTDWFISFAHLGRGDSARAIAAAPLLLLVQLVMLPLYVWWLIGDLAIELTAGSHLLAAFSGLIVTPLILAWLTERVAERHIVIEEVVDELGWLPIPLLALVVFLIAGSQVSLVVDNGMLLWRVVAVFVLYLVVAAALGKLLSQAFRLPAATGRTLTFSLGTRNSFVMLPLALSLPEAWSAAVVVIVLQSLVELFGMVAFLRWVPTRLIK